MIPDPTSSRKSSQTLLFWGFRRMVDPVVKLIPPPATPVARPSENRLSMRAEHKASLGNVATEAAAIAGAAAKIVQSAHEALANGGAIQIQPQIAFLNGSLARLIKDWGVVEHLQKHGVRQRTTR